MQPTHELRAMIAGTALSSQNIVFFSTRGPRALADQLSGGDYDGDRFLVISNPAITDAFITQSESWEEPRAPQSGRGAPPIADQSEDVIDKGLATHWLRCIKSGGMIGRVHRGMLSSSQCQCFVPMLEPTLPTCLSSHTDSAATLAPHSAALLAYFCTRVTLSCSSPICGS